MLRIMALYRARLSSHESDMMCNPGGHVDPLTQAFMPRPSATLCTAPVVACSSYSQIAVLLSLFKMPVKNCFILNCIHLMHTNSTYYFAHCP